MADPQSVADWLRLAAMHERMARLGCDDRLAAQQGQWHTGMGVEAALKAYIMHVRRLNRWPDPPSPLHTHNLRILVREAGIVLNSQHPVGPAWHVMLQYDRSQGYEPKPMPRRVARSYLEAAFGPSGVVTWLRTLLP